MTYARTLIAFAASIVAFATAHAQSPATPGTGTMGSGTYTGTVGPGTPGVTGATGYGAGAMTPGTPGAATPNQALNPGFSGSNYRTATDCLNAAQSAGVSRNACNGRK